MEHDEEIPAIVRADGASSGSHIAGGDAAVAVVPELESGGSGGAARAEQREPTPPEADGDEDQEEEAPPAPARGAGAGGGGTPSGKGPKGKRHPTNVRRLRIERMMSKAELARRANLSVLTIDRVEKGYGCRMDSKRKILEALGLSLADRVRVFGEEE